MKLLAAYFKIKPVLYTFAILCIAAIAANQYINRPKIYNNPWIVVDVMSGDRFMAERKGQELEVQLCGISASKGSRDYLRSRRDPRSGSLINQGNGWVILDRVIDEDGITVAEVFVERHDEQEIHLNTEMLMANKAILSNYKACPNAEYFELAVKQ